MWDIDEDKIKIICTLTIIFFCFITLIEFFPFIKWIIIILGITIPTYILIKKRNEE
jgi:hypothetical protein